MIKNVKRGIFVVLIFLISIGLVNSIYHRCKISQLSDINVTKIVLEHYNEEIEITPEDPNFNKIIELTSKQKLSFRYIGLLLYGQPITATFYENDNKMISIAPGVSHTIVNNTRYFSSFRSRNTAKELDTILGIYYGYVE